MNESWEPEPDDSRSVDEERNDAESAGEAFSTDEVLREWIERLEQELANRNLTIDQLRTALLEKAAEAGLEQSSGEDDLSASVKSPNEDQFYHRILALENAIFERDELIAELQGKLSSQETNLAALHLEWEQLRDWAEEVEQRIELAGCYDEVFNSVPFPPRATSESRFESRLMGRRADWEIERGELVREIENLREDLNVAQTASVKPNDSLESENIRLIETIEYNRAEYERLIKTHQRATDEYESRERDHLRTINELRAELKEAEVRERKTAELSESQEKQAPKPNPLESDERIRAFRLHLDGIHAQESAKRAPKPGLLGIRWFKSAQRRS